MMWILHYQEFVWSHFLADCFTETGCARHPGPHPSATGRLVTPSRQMGSRLAPALLQNSVPFPVTTQKRWPLLCPGQMGTHRCGSCTQRSEIGVEIPYQTQHHLSQIKSVKNVFALVAELFVQACARTTSPSYKIRGGLSFSSVTNACDLKRCTILD